MKTVGVDVGAFKKGYHAVANENGSFSAKFHSANVDEIVSWILKQEPTAIAIDAPSMFSQSGRSRLAERLLVTHGIRCFYTPTRELAKNSRFYDWVFNAELLFQKLNLPTFMGEKIQSPCVIETFPHGVHLSFWNHQFLKSKLRKFLARKHTLEQKAQYKTSSLGNIDFIDAALCAISADYFTRGEYIAFGSKEEGYIVLPDQSYNLG